MGLFLYFCGMMPDISPIHNWLNSPKPLVVAGPCSAESEEQLLATAKEISRLTNTKVFRAGIWKPRTRPNSFEGVGNKGLQWLQRVKAETGMLTAVEVANSAHVEQALLHSVDVLWIGARTVVNPFSIQEIAVALKGVHTVVMIKNPVSPDIEAWMGAIERVKKAGIDIIIAVHRGFSSFVKTPCRNAPMWEIPIELKRRVPGLPILCDPSHITGKRELIAGISQKALDLEMDGLMIETHVHPEKALTDARQQISPVQLKELLDNLIIRKPSGNTEFETRLDLLRNEIDKLDSALIDIVGRRMEVVKEIGQYKKENNITILQIQRWRNIINDWQARGGESSLDLEFLMRLLDEIHRESIRIQTQILEQ